MDTDRFFRWMIGGIALLAVAAVGVALYRQRQAHYRQDDSPQAVVYNYLLALRRGEWDKAYNLLGDTPCKPDRTAFKMTMENWRFFPAVDIENVRQEGEKAWITLRFYYDTGPFGGLAEVRDSSSMVLRRENGRWKMVEVPPPIWPFPPLGTQSCPDHPPAGGD